MTEIDVYNLILNLQLFYTSTSLNGPFNSHDRL